MTSMSRGKCQVYSVGNYLMTGKVLGKGHFARVEEATHRIIGKKVAIKIIDLTCIKEEYARRNLHREPRVMAKLQHPCIAALYETMMHGPRLYVVMEAAGGGDLCSLVLAARGAARGLPEGRARSLAAQLVSAVRHMHARGVVHRDLKMENIMLDTTKQYIKIVDFGLSNMWSAGGTLQTPCGSLEYAAPELFVDGHKYGPEVDLWSIGVIVYGMVTGGLPFASAGAEGGSRGQLRAAIAKGFGRKQRAALAAFTTECKTFIQHLLEPKVEQRMRIEEAARHRWVKRPGLRMKTHPFANVDAKFSRELYRQIAELLGATFMDVVQRVKAEPFGDAAGMYNMKIHLHRLQATSGADVLWSANAQEPRPASPPEYRAKYENKDAPQTSRVQLVNDVTRHVPRLTFEPKPPLDVKLTQTKTQHHVDMNSLISNVNKILQSPRKPSRPNIYGLKKPISKIYETGDGVESRLPSIEEHSNVDVEGRVLRKVRTPCVRTSGADGSLRLASGPNRGDVKRFEFYKRAGDGLPSWRSCGIQTPSARLLLQTNATSIKRASLGNIVSPHSSSNSHCKSEKSMSVGWHSSRAPPKETHLQRLRRTAPMK